MNVEIDEGAIRDAGINGFTAQARQALTEYADWLRSPECRDHIGCPACARVWAFHAGQLGSCVEGLLGVIDAACLPVGGRHEPRPDPYLPDHQENPDV